MVLYLIGLGLGDEKDITVRGLEAIKTCDSVFLENYTSILGIDHKRLEEFYQKPIILADRDTVECEADRILSCDATKNVALLVVGDVFCATTHTDFVLRARELNIPVEIINNNSVMNAVGHCGLQLYSYGQTVSIPFFRDEWKPDSFYEKIAFNRQGKLHTLCLLDIKVKEPDYDALLRSSSSLGSSSSKSTYLPPRFMTVNQALAQLLEIEAKRDEKVLSGSDTYCVGMARLGQHDQCIKVGTMDELLNYEGFGPPLHCLVIIGGDWKDLHDVEREVGVVLFMYYSRLDD